MIWNKSGFSYLMWVAYLVIVVTAMAFTGSAISIAIGGRGYYGMIAAAVYLLSAGIFVLGLHRMAVKTGGVSANTRKILLWIERIVFAVLLAAGLFLRLTKLRTVSLVSPYAGAAYIAAGQDVPQFAHGAVHVYIRALHILFMLLGNKEAAALGMQIALQLLGVACLYFAVRKMAGSLPAVTMLAFFMLSPYMVDKAVTLSPEMLYLLLFSFVLLFVSLWVGRDPGWKIGCLTGVMAAFLGYLDVAGILLVPVILGMIWTKREDKKENWSGATLGCLGGFLLGVAVCVLVDVQSSGKSARGVIQAWRNLYQWSGPQLSVTISGFGTACMTVLLLGFMAWGIYSFWCHKRSERFSIWMCCLAAAAVMKCLGIFTEEMDGYCYIFLFSTILAGLGVMESMTVHTVKRLETLEDEEILELMDFDSLEGNEAQDGRKRRKKEDGRGREGHAKDAVRGDDLADGESLKHGEEAGNEKAVKCGESESGQEDRADQKDRADQGENSNREDERNAGDNVQEAAGRERQTMDTEGKQEGKREVEYIENPLPLPKKHEKRVMDYKLNSERDLGGYDVEVAEGDDFDH